MVTATREFAASATRSVLMATEELRNELSGSGSSVDYAVRRLESAARRSIDGLDGIEARGFDQPARDPESARIDQLPPVDDVLAVALSQLNVASALVAAERAMQERAEPPITQVPTEQSSTALDDSVRELRAATATLSASARSRERQGFESAPSQPLSSEDAAAACRRQLSATLDTLCEKAAAVATQSLTATQRLAPKQVQDALSSLGGRLSLGSPVRGLARLAVRALDGALRALTNLVPLPALQRFRERVHELWVRLETEPIVSSLMATLFDVSGAQEQSEAALAHEPLPVARVQQATTDIAGLGTRFDEHAKLASGVITGIVSASAALGFLQLGIPHLGVITAGAVLLVLGTIVIIGMDFADVENVLKRVRGVREVLREMIA